VWEGDSEALLQAVRFLGMWRGDRFLELKTLPLHHKDPFDRMLIAQSKIENATLVSR
jgi:PIN domain nuclease of toxin-antitoxin system